MPLVLGSDFFALGIAVGVLGLVLLLSLIIAYAYDEPTLFCLALYLVSMTILLLAAGRLQLPKGLTQSLLLILGPLTAAALQVWVLRSRKITMLGRLAIAGVFLASVGLMIFQLVLNAESFAANDFAVNASIALAVVVGSCLGYSALQSWDAAGPWKWWLLLGQFAGFGISVLFLADVADAKQDYWPVVLMLLVQVPPIYLSLVWRSRLLNEIRLRGAAAGVIDPLTGLATTPVLIERLMRVMARAQQNKTGQAGNALFLIEVQNWHGLLAELGADFTEKLLLESAMRLRRSVGDNDMVGRVSGGRFAVVAHGLANQNDINALATKLVVSGLRIDSPLLPGVELKFRIIVLNLKLTAPLALPVAQAWLDSLVSRFQAWPSSHRSRSILVIEQDDDVRERFEPNSNY